MTSLMSWIGYAVTVFLAIWLIGPFVGLPLTPLMVMLNERRLRRKGIQVAGDWTEDQRQEVFRSSRELGADTVLWGRAIAVGVAAGAYLQLVMASAPGWLWGVSMGLIYLMSRGRIQFALVTASLQLATNLLLR